MNRNTKQAKVKEYERQIDPVRSPIQKVSADAFGCLTSNGVDQIVYKLYGLTQEEIRIVVGEK